MRIKSVFLFSLFAICLAGCGNNVDTNAIYQDGYTDGYDAGYQIGYATGYEAGENSSYFTGYQDGFNAGKSVGYDQGYAAGYEAGIKASGKAAFVRPGTNLVFHTDKQQSYIDDNNPENISNYASGASGQEYCNPNSIHLDWSDVTFIESISSYKVILSDNSSFSSSLEYTSTATNLDVYNLKLNTKYYWYLKATGVSSNFISPIFNFTTKNGIIRNLKVPHTTNWRDMGNYTLSSGKTIKQGLLYRSAAFGFLDGTTSSIHQETKECILNELKIKTNIDLATTESISGMTYVGARMEYEGITNLIADTGNQASIKTVFDSLGNSNNYPQVFHCTRGRDRTGAIAFLVGAYLGMSTSDLYRDYLFTNFSANNSCAITPIKGYVQYLATFAGSTLQEQTKNYLLNIGVTQSTLNNITTILVGN